jgi:prepilin-type N-terminal cleavage/methylation domain-containing protein
MFKKFLKQQEGFTLVELLIVILILGALAAVAIPRFINMQQDAIISSCRNNQASIETAFEQYLYYRAIDPTVPAPVAGFNATNLATPINPTINGVVTPVTILKRAPVCPGGGGNYIIDIANGTVACPSGH